MTLKMDIPIGYMEKEGLRAYYSIIIHQKIIKML
jgi:hypothetical protein